jgi:hypothetical protein
MRKLNCLIAVLEVATAKVKKSMDGSPPDAERLARICANLQSTLEVCQRARAALEKRQACEGGRASTQERALTVQPAPPPAAQRRQRPPPKPKDQKPRQKRNNGVRWGKGIRPPASDLASEVERRKFAKLPPIDKRSIASCDLDDLFRRLTT